MNAPQIAGPTTRAPQARNCQPRRDSAALFSLGAARSCREQRALAIAAARAALAQAEAAVHTLAEAAADMRAVQADRNAQALRGDLAAAHAAAVDSAVVFGLDTGLQFMQARARLRREQLAQLLEGRAV